MKEYNYKSIKYINEKNIELCDGTIIDLEECRRNWSLDHGTKVDNSECVADRNIVSDNPFFIFYSDEKLKLVFTDRLLFFTIKNKKKFRKLQLQLNKLHYSSYDCT